MKKLSKLLCVGALASAMAFTMVPTSVLANEVSGDGTIENESKIVKEKAKFENLNLVMRQFSMTDNGWGKVFPFESFNLHETFSLVYEDTVENKDVTGMYHMTFKNLSKDMIKIRFASNMDEEEFKDVIESVDTGRMQKSKIEVVALKAGTAKVECTIYDIENPSITKTEIVTLTINDIPPAPDFDIAFTGEEDFLVDVDRQNEVIDFLRHSDGNVYLGLGLSIDLDTITLPKEILDAAKKYNVSLTVKIDMLGKDNTWTFPKNIDNVNDVNLVMNVVNANEIDSLKDKDGLVLAFNHDGMLPTGTTVKTYVGDSYKAGSKVQLSYFNEKTNTLEETKEYVVDIESYVTVTINHCSNYLLEKASDEVKPTPEPTPQPDTTTPDITTPDTTTPDTETSTKPITTDTGKEAVQTGNAMHTFMFISFLSLAGIALITYKRKENQM